MDLNHLIRDLGLKESLENIIVDPNIRPNILEPNRGFTVLNPNIRPILLDQNLTWQLTLNFDLDTPGLSSVPKNPHEYTT